jgi:hypothetical protein
MANHYDKRMLKLTTMNKEIIPIEVPLGSVGDPGMLQYYYTG